MRQPGSRGNVAPLRDDGATVALITAQVTQEVGANLQCRHRMG